MNAIYFSMKGTSEKVTLPLELDMENKGCSLFDISGTVKACIEPPIYLCVNFVVNSIIVSSDHPTERSMQLPILHQINLKKTNDDNLVETFVFFVLCVVPVRVQIADILCKLLCFNLFNGIFGKILCIGNITHGLYQVVRECGHLQVPEPKLYKEECEQDQQPLQSALPLKDEYLVETQTRQTLVIEEDSSLLTPLTIDEMEWKETVQMEKQPDSTTDKILKGEISSAK